MTSSQALEESELTPEVDQGTQSGLGNNVATDATARRPHNLVPKDVAKRLSRKSDAIGLAYFVAHSGLIGFGAWLTLLTFPGLVFIPVLLLHSFILGFLFSPLHECAHGTAFRSRWLNETILWIVAIVYIVPPYFFRYFHLGHHRFTQVPGKDPSLVLPQPANLRQYLWYCAGLWFWWRNFTWICRHAIGIVDPSSAYYVPKQRLGMMVTEARILAALYIPIIGGALATGFGLELLLCWLLPRFIGEPIQRIVRVAEHVGCAESSDLLENTRTTLSNRMINTVAWQMPYHAEHHLFPAVPFHQLPRLHELVKSKIVMETGGYIAGQKEIVAMLRSNSGEPKCEKLSPNPLL